MIEARQLRIGNYIFEPYSGIMVVAAIIDLYVLLRKEGMSVTGEYSLNGINPIPLTEQWLIDFGADKDKEFYLLEDIKIFINNNHFYHLNDSMLIHFDHVHRLQNFIFEVTDKELIKQ